MDPIPPHTVTGKHTCQRSTELPDVIVESKSFVNVLDTLSQYMEKYMPPAEELDYEPPDEQKTLVNHLIESKKRKWNTTHSQERLYDQQLKLCNYLNDRFAKLGSMATEINGMLITIADLKTRLRSNTLPPEAVVETERALTMAEYHCHELHHIHTESKEEYKNLRKEFKNNMESLRQMKLEYNTEEDEIKTKRARLDSLPIKDAEYYIFNTLVAEKNKSQESLNSLKQTYMPYHCNICSDDLATLVLPCCHHLLCQPCTLKMVKVETSSFPCPYCRHKVDMKSIIKMQF
jgi:hypothetical protein